MSYIVYLHLHKPLNAHLPVTAGLIAQLLVTTVASFNYVASVMLMAVFQALGIVVFLAARKRYVRRSTDRFKVINFIKAIFLCCLPCKRKKKDEGERRSSYVAAVPGPDNLRETRGGILPDKFVDGFIRLLWINSLPTTGSTVKRLHVCIYEP